MTSRIDTADVAKLARKALKKAFPGQKFQVKSKRYSGGSSITARWIDGPTSKRVGAVIGHMHGAEFDGMTDSMNYNGSSYGNDFIFCSRDISDDARRRIAEKLASDELGVDADEVDSPNRRFPVVYLEGRICLSSHDHTYGSSLVDLVASETELDTTDAKAIGATERWIT